MTPPAGTLNQFATVEAVQNIVKTAGENELTRLIKTLELIALVQSYSVRGIFLSNSTPDANGTAFLNVAKNIEFIGPPEILGAYVSDKKEPLQAGEASFDLAGFTKASYIVDKDTHTIIAPVMASELVQLKGIADQSLFSYNVRASLGNTKVNRDIVRSIHDNGLHKLFPLFHNGVTVLAEKVTDGGEKITITNYFVVNGCQSLNALFQNKARITDQLRVLTKFIQVPAGSELSGLITAYSNNQNGVKARDFKSNNPIQTRLQNEFKKSYQGRFAFEIKRGEPLEAGTPISNELAGLYLIAFDLKEPWTTHRKYQVFDDKYGEIFARPEVDASRIVLCHLVATEINARLDSLKNQLIAKYVLTQFLVLYVVRRLLDSEEFGTAVVKDPSSMVLDVATYKAATSFFGSLLDEIMVDLNLETEELGEDFDYRGKLRDKDYVSEIANKVLGSYLKDVKRKKALTLSELWAKVYANK